MAKELDGIQPIKIRVFEITSEAYEFVKANALALLTLSVVPFLAIFLASVVAAMWPLNVALNILEWFVRFCSMVLFAVAVHRFFLLHERPQLHCGWREIRFGFYTIGTMAAAWVGEVFTGLGAYANSLLLGPTVGMVSGIVVMIVTFYVSLRISLIFPFVAIGYPGRSIDLLKMSWKKMHGNVWALFGALIVMSVVVGLITFIPISLFFNVIIESGISTGVFYEAAFLDACFSILLDLFTVLFASICFKKLVGADRTHHTDTV